MGKATYAVLERQIKTPSSPHCPLLLSSLDPLAIRELPFHKKSTIYIRLRSRHASAWAKDPILTPNKGPFLAKLRLSFH